jgi:rSAM-associated Gly-rich repeat protein
MNSESDNDQKRPFGRKLAKSLSALFALSSGIILGATSKAEAVTTSSSAGSNGPEKLEVRVAKLTEQFNETSQTAVNQGDLPAGAIRTLGWGNWHNWHRGWGNGGWHRPGWGNGGWGNGNWHNWHNWHNG